jgi:hypothetical protein
VTSLGRGFRGFLYGKKEALGGRSPGEGGGVAIEIGFCRNCHIGGLR